MEQLIHEDAPKYDLKYKIVIVAAPVLTFILGLLTYVDGYWFDILPGRSEAGSRITVVVMFVATALITALYWVLLPKRFSIFGDRVEIRFGIRCLNIEMERIKEGKPVEGGILWAGFGCITSSSNTVEISTQSGMNVRISPSNRDLFLENLNKALRPRINEAGLGSLLQKEGIISEKQLDIALDYQAEIGGQIGALLVKLGFVQPDVLADILSRTLLIQTADLSKKKLDWDTINKVGRDLLESHLVVPVQGERKKVTLVMADPTDIEIVREIEFMMGLPSVEEVAPQSDIIQIFKDLPEPVELVEEGPDVPEADADWHDSNVTDVIKALVETLIESRSITEADLNEALGREEKEYAVAPEADAKPHSSERNWRNADTTDIVRGFIGALVEAGVVKEEKLNEKLFQETENKKSSSTE